MGAAVICVPVPARREDPCRIHGKAAPVARGLGPHLCPAPGGGQGHEGWRVRLGQGGARTGREGLGWGRAEGVGMSVLTGSCVCTLGSGTQPHPTSCHKAPDHTASDIFCTGTPAGVEWGAASLSEGTLAA